jgi:hypothetical protein
LQLIFCSASRATERGIEKLSDILLEEETEEEKIENKKAKKSNYINNDQFEKLILDYRKTKDEQKLLQLHQIFKSIAERVYSMAVRNIFSRVNSLFPYPNYHDREDLIHNALYWSMRGIDYWCVKHYEGKKKSKADRKSVV